MMEKNTLDQLLKVADKTREFAYAPYSKFRVGCAILLEDGTTVTGVNIENAAYGVVLCAERAAMATIISSGRQKAIKAVAVVTDAVPPGSPCGMCRQFLSEFLPEDLPIVFGNGKDSVLSSIRELLPYAFSKAALN